MPALNVRIVTYFFQQMRYIRVLLYFVMIMCAHWSYAQGSSSAQSHIKILFEIRTEVAQRARDFIDIEQVLRESEKKWANELSRIYWITHAYISHCVSVFFLYDIMNESSKERVLEYMRGEKKYCTLSLGSSLRELLIIQGSAKEGNTILYADHLRNAIRKAEFSINKISE